MSCQPLIIDTHCKPVHVDVGQTQTVITVAHAPAVVRGPYIVWTFGPVQDQVLPGPSGAIHMTQMTDSQFVVGTIQPVDKKGNPAPVQAGSVVYTTSDPAVITAAADAANELSVAVTAVAPGAARLSVTFDADLGDGVTTVEVFEDFSITGGPAVGASISFGTPQEQP